MILLSIHSHADPSEWKYGRGKICRPKARSVLVLVVLRDTLWTEGSVIRGLVAIGFTIWSGYDVAYGRSARLYLCPDNTNRAIQAASARHSRKKKAVGG